VNVLLISQCDKRALSESRRILDQFAERRGDRTWQTPITQAGLDTLRKLLRKTARKNSAVACHWIRGRDHSELLWIVGDARRFNAEGAVPTNTTQRNVLRREDENDWHTAEDIRLLAQLSALLHDLGKASVAFQNRLQGRFHERNLYRHEWVSLRLFLAFVGDDNDDGWLRRLSDADSFDEQHWIAEGRYQRDGLDVGISECPFEELTQRAPLAAAVAWLVVTHHRLPVVPVEKEQGGQDWLGKRARNFKSAWLEFPLAQVAHNWNELLQPASHEQVKPFWNLAGVLPVVEPKWRKQAARLATGLIELRRRDTRGDWLSNPYVMHLARLSLMLADHHYSSLPKASPQRVTGDGNTTLYANTDKDGSLKQPLDEHLLGVARDAGLIVSALPGFERHLPRLGNHPGLRKRSGAGKFAWQDKATDAATSLREVAREHGAFVVNMASTGCGKTLANARILYALADPQMGLRATYALGLRTLTQQTGRVYRDDLHLSDDELAVRVGGSASRLLFAYYEQQAEASGSASTQKLIDEDTHVYYEGNTANHPMLSRALRDVEIRNLISAPMLVCTVDHLVPATESLRAGRQIAPMLRLMSADLILDELDDYDLDDLPALTRLVHWAGLLGTRVVLSSATLPPSLVQGMFMAYRAGRKHYRRNRGADGGVPADQPEIPCLWTDEFGAHSTTCKDANSFATHHSMFVAKRAGRLTQAEPLRRGSLWPLNIGKGSTESQRHAEFAGEVQKACLRLHDDHAESDPVSGKRVSFGIVRMANIGPLFEVAKHLIASDLRDDTRIHLCVYHSRFPSVLRSAIEHQLDATFNRRDDGGQSVYRLPAIRTALDENPESNQLFVVLASPVCEVGRDWDADWAVAEPSSMRALIQLAGRVQRHRCRVSDKPNVLIFDTNLNYFKNTLEQGKPAAIYLRPGFEKASKTFRLLPKRRLGSVLESSEFAVLTALPRISPRETGSWEPTKRWVDLEQARIAACMLPREQLPKSLQPDFDAIERDEAAVSWLHPNAALTGLLPQQQPFRDDPQRSETLVFLPDDEGENPQWHRIEESGGREPYEPIPEQHRCHPLELALSPRASRWGNFDLMNLLADQAEFFDLPLRDAARKLATVEVPESTQGWQWHPWLGFNKA